ncbi:MAG: hypothetical protein WBC93_02970 [Sulfitobacter sp.]
MSATSAFYLRIVGAFCALAMMALSAQADISRFTGSYSGSAEVVAADGSKVPRDMSVNISETSDGFRVEWRSNTTRADGSVKEKSYSIDFVVSDRANVFGAAMKRNVFGHEVQLDPMKGEPYVWARIEDETLTVYSLHINAEGGYEIQQFDRTLAEDGLTLDFSSIRSGAIQRSVSTLLKRE